MFSDPVHTCILTATTYDGRVPDPCPGCTASASRLGVIVRTMREVHPVTCGCSRCYPWDPSQVTGGNLPTTSMLVSLADGELPPVGWKFPGIGGA